VQPLRGGRDCGSGGRRSGGCTPEGTRGGGIVAMDGRISTGLDGLIDDYVDLGDS